MKYYFNILSIINFKYAQLIIYILGYFNRYFYLGDIDILNILLSHKLILVIS